jgi:catechol 2,3-dioxygenase-like lactoylglutathione lyase family enzyme
MEDSAHPGGVLGPHAAALRAALLQPFLRLNFVTLWVRDQERSRRFFVEKLNFEAIVDLPTPDGGRWIVVAPLAAGWLPGTAGACLGSPSLFHRKDPPSTNASVKAPDLAFLPKTCVACSKNGRDAESVFRSHR